MKQLIPHFAGFISNGLFELDDKQKFVDHIKNMKDGEAYLYLKRKPKAKKDRSLEQNNYYWGVVIRVMANSLGYSKDEHQYLHDSLRMLLLRTEQPNKLPSIRSTTDLSTIEFEDYMSQCRQLASKEYGIYIPLPNETEYAYKSSG